MASYQAQIQPLQSRQQAKALFSTVGIVLYGSTVRESLLDIMNRKFQHRRGPRSQPPKLDLVIRLALLNLMLYRLEWNSCSRMLSTSHRIAKEDANQDTMQARKALSEPSTRKSQKTPRTTRPCIDHHSPASGLLVTSSDRPKEPCSSVIPQCSRSRTRSSIESCPKCITRRRRDADTSVAFYPSPTAIRRFRGAAPQ